MHITLIDHSEETLEIFAEFVARSEQVIECATITGRADYVIKVAARDPEGLESFIMNDVLRLGVVQNTLTNFILRHTKTSSPLPVIPD